MNIKSTHNQILWASCFAACLPFSASHADTLFSVMDLGDLGGTYSLGLGVNNNGLVSGFSYLGDNTSEQAALSQRLTLPQALGTFGGNYAQAYSINNLGQVVGSATLTGDGQYHAFQWQTPLSPIQDLKPLVSNGYSRAFSINDNGLIAGVSSTATGTEHAVVWQQRNGNISDLGTLNGTGSSEGLAINVSGQVAGFSTVTGGSTHAVLWSNGSRQDLGTLGGSYSAAYGINNSGEITGTSRTALNAHQHAFLWRPNTPPAMTDLGTFGGTFSQGNSISLAGDIVGFSTTLNDVNERAFLWQEGVGLQDLNALIDPFSGWILLEAHGISEDSKYITGMGTLNGQHHAFLLTRMDTTPPNVSFQLVPAQPSVSGWYLTAPSLVWSVTDAESAISLKTGCTDVASVANTSSLGMSFNCTATSSGGTAGAMNTPMLKVDTTLPTFTNVPVDRTVAATSATGAVVTYIAPTANDTFSGVSTAGVSCAPASGTTLPIGANTITCSASDMAGNSNRASFVVTVADQTPPDVVFNINPATPSASGWYLTAPTTSWSVTDAQSTATIVTGCANGVQLDTDGAGRTLSCTAKSAGGAAGPIDKVIKVDTVLPTLTGVPANIISSPTSAAGAAVSYTLPVAVDPAPGSGLNGGVSCLPASGSTFPTGTTRVDCSVSDMAGNSRTANFSVTVTDNTPPQVSFQLTPPAADGQAGWYKTSPGLAWTVTDPHTAIASKLGCTDVAVVGNTAGQAFSCTATSGGGTTGPMTTPMVKVDTTLPMFANIPLSSTVAATSSAGAVVNYTAPTVSDTFSGMGIGGLSCAPASGSTLPLGANTISCSASDMAGNSNTASFVVTVADQRPPVFSSCPATVAIIQGQALPQLTATDNVSTPLVSRTPAGSLGLGTTPVTWTATDQAGLSATCVQQVTVSAPITETISVTRAECKRINTTAGQWNIQGTSSISTNNSIQLYTTATVPADLNTNKVGAAVTVSKGAWLNKSNPGPACSASISLRSSASGKELNAISVRVQ